MTIEYDDKGKYFTEVVSKIPIPGLGQITQHLIRGKVHVRRDERLKNELDRDEPFRPITDASVLGTEGQVFHQVRFLGVRRTQIIWVMPLKNETQGGIE